MLFKLTDTSTWTMPELDFNFWFAVVLSVAFVCYLVYVFVKENKKLGVYDISLIAIFTALSVVLSKIELVSFPQGGGITLCQFLPIMVLTLLTGKRNGILAGLAFGLINLIGGYLIHPVQIIFDYILPPMAISLVLFDGKKEKKDLLINFLVTFIVFIGSMCLSGATFFGSFAPEGQNVWLYSIIYNATGSGVDLLIDFVILFFLPLDRLARAIRK